jgi:acyl-CoA synthetase (AMP-forming)/AMP-acid ligase II
MSASARTVPRLLQRQVLTRPDSPALGAPGGQPISYAAVSARVGALIEVLRARGVGPGDRVALVLPGGPDMAVAFLGVTAGAACAPLNPAYRPEEFRFYFEDLAPKLLLTRAAMDSAAMPVAGQLGISTVDLEAIPLEPVASRMSPEPLEQDVALLLHTSGTTARPKLVPLTHANLYASAAHVAATLQLGPEDRCLNVMPLFHIHGLIAGLLAPLGAGGSVVCAPAFLAPSFFSWVEQCRPTWYTAVPTMHQAILGRAERHRELLQRHRLRFLRSSSAAMPPQVMAGLEEAFGAPVIEAYGMTEAAHQMASNPLPPDHRKPGSVGRAAGPEIAIMDQAGRVLPAGRDGEVVIRGPNVFRGYEGNPEANHSAFAGGWFRTGDEGFLDDDGYLFITGRLKELINRGGEKIAPREIEEVLLDHPAVAEAVAFAISDSLMGEEVGAAVVLRPGAVATERDLRTLVAERLADFKVPRLILFRDALPKGATGKVQRIGLAARLGLTELPRHVAPARDAAPPRSPTEQRIARIWSDVLGIQQGPGVHDHFLDLGGDSVLAAQVVSRMRKELCLEVSQRSVFDAPTVAEQAAVIDELLGSAAGQAGSP